MSYYLGVGPAGARREVFFSVQEPTETCYVGQYRAVIGPFKTLQGAAFMRDHGRNNPHCRTVEDAERLASLTTKETGMTQRRFTTKDPLGNVYYLVVGQHVILTGTSRQPLSLSYASIRDEVALTFALEDIRDSNDTKANTTKRMLEAVRKYCSNPQLEWTEFFP